MKNFIPILLFLTIICIGSARAEEPSPTRTRKTIELPPETVNLKPGNGLDRVQVHCLVCHSSNYITMQPPFTKAQWTALTAKMIKVFGAKVTDDDARIISDYLAENYGMGKQ